MSRGLETMLEGEKQSDSMDPEKEREKAEKLLSQQLRSHFKSKTIVEYLANYKLIDKVDSTTKHLSNNSMRFKENAATKSSFMSPTRQPQDNLSDMTLNTPPSCTPSPSPEKRNREAMRGGVDLDAVNGMGCNHAASLSPPRLIKKLGRGARKKELKLRHDVSYVSQLNELTQAMGWSNPRFEHTCVGTAHAQLFKVQCHVNGLEFHADESTSKLQLGKEKASLQALQHLFNEQS